MDNQQSQRGGAKLSRRVRVLGVAALGISVSLVLAGCTGATQGSTSTSAATAGTAGLTGTPVAGDTMTVGEQNSPDSPNPALVPQTDFTMLTYDSLMYLSSDGTVQPALATSWQYSGSDNKQLDITLRDGVTFSDGSPVTADAVKASLEYTQSTPGNQSPYLAGATFNVTGPLTLSIVLSAPNPILPTLLTQTYGVGAIMGPTALADPSTMDATHASDGAGAYIYDPSQSVAGDHYTYTANPSYYDTSKQHWKKIVLQTITNEQSAVNAAKTGQLDVYKGDYSSIDQALAAGLQAVGVPNIVIGLTMMDRNGAIAPALGDLRVRQAINYAIDRNAVTTALLGSYGTPTVQTSVEGGDGYSSDAASEYAFDPDKAKSLLTEAGYPNGFTLNVSTAPFGGFQTMAEAIQGQLAKVGITLNLTVASDGATYVGNAAGGQFPAIVGGFSAYPMFIQGQQTFLPNALYNPFHTQTDQLTTLYNQAAEANDTDRPAIDEQIQKYLVDNAWFAPVSATPLEYFAAPNIGGLAVSAENSTASLLDWYTTK